MKALSHSGVNPDFASLPANWGCRPTAAPTNSWALRTGEAFVVPGDEMRFNLLNRIESNAYDYHQTRSAEAEGNTKVVGKEVGEYAND